MADHAVGKKVEGVREVTKELKSLSPMSKKEIVDLRRKRKVSQSAFAIPEHFDQDCAEMGAAGGTDIG